MRTIGMDLGVSGSHTAVIADETGRFITPLLKLHTDIHDLDQLLARTAGDSEREPVQVVMEPTGMAWFPLAIHFTRQKVPVYLVNPQQTASLRQFYKRHAKSDKIDARVLAKLPMVNGEQMYSLSLPTNLTQACRRACKELQRVTAQITAIHNRIRDIDRFAWPGLKASLFKQTCSPRSQWIRQHWYNPSQVVAAGVQHIQRAWRASGIDPDDPGEWVPLLVKTAQSTLQLYGAEGHYLDYDLLQAEICREQDHMHYLQSVAHDVRQNTLYPLYKQIHPSRNLETIKGVGKDGAAVYASFISDPARFASLRTFRGWSGMVPNSKQSADSEAKGLHITQAGPNLIKKFAYINADVARLWDPQIAAIYYDQMVHKGKHHTQAVCACATHLLDRILIVLREDRPYELRDVNGKPVSSAEAKAIIAQRYRVPDDVRRRNTKRARRRRTDTRAERKQRGKAA